MFTRRPKVRMRADAAATTASAASNRDDATATHAT